MATAWSQQELEALRKRLEESGRVDEGVDEGPGRSDEVEKALVRLDQGGPEELEAALRSAAKAGPADRKRLLGRVSEVVARSEASVKAALVERLRGLVDEVARRLVIESTASLGRFLREVYGALGATMGDSPVVAALAAKPKVEATEPKFLARIFARAGGDEKPAIGLGFALTERLGSFLTRLDARMLGVNRMVGDHLGRGLGRAERFFDFDRRFQVASFAFGGRSVSAGGFAGAWGGVGPEFFYPAMDEKEPVFGSSLFGTDAAIDMPYAAPVFSMTVGTSYFAPAPVGSRRSVSASPGAFGSRRRPLVSEQPLRVAGKFDPAVLSAATMRNAKALSLAFGGRMTEAEAAAVTTARSPLQALRGYTALTAGVMDHLALGFQSVVENEEYGVAAHALERLAFGRVVADRAAAFVGTPSTSYVPRIARTVAGEMAARPAVAGRSMISSISSFARRSLRFAEPLRSVASARRARAVAQGVEAPARTVSTFAIRTDAFGLPRFRGAVELPLVSLEALSVAGLDFSGSVVTKTTPLAAPTIESKTPRAAEASMPLLRAVAGRTSFAPLAEPTIGTHRTIGYTADEFGIVRLARRAELPLSLEERAAAMPRALSFEPKIGGLGRLAFRALDEGALAAPRSLVAADIEMLPLLPALAVADVEVAPRPRTEIPGIELVSRRPSIGAIEPSVAPRSSRRPEVRATAAARGTRKAYLGSSFTGLSRARTELARPAVIAKYYAPLEAPALALGRASAFRLASFGGFSAARREVRALEADLAPTALGRLQAGFEPAVAPLGRLVWAAEGPRVVSRRGLSVVDAAAPAVRLTHPAEIVPAAARRLAWDLGGFAPAARLGRVRESVERYAAVADARYRRVGREVEALRRTYSGARMWRSEEAPSVVAARGPEGAPTAPEPIRFAPPSDAGEVRLPSVRSRASEPRLLGVYGRRAAFAPTMGDVLGLRRRLGFEALHTPSAVVPRLGTLGLDAVEMPARRGFAMLRAGGVGTFGLARGARPLEVGEGFNVSTPRFDFEPTELPLSWKAPLGTAVPEMPRALRAGFAERFSLDGWMGGTTHSEAADVTLPALWRGTPYVETAVGGGLAGRELEYALPELRSVGVGSVPFDLASQLSGRTEMMSRAVELGQARTIARTLRNIEVGGVAEGAFGRLSYWAEGVAPRTSRARESEVPVGRAGRAVPSELRTAVPEVEWTRGGPVEAGETPRLGARRPAEVGEKVPTAARGPAEAAPGLRRRPIGRRVVERAEPGRSVRPIAGVEKGSRLIGRRSGVERGEFVGASSASEGPADLLFFKRREGPAAITVEPDTRLGARIRSDRGAPLTAPVREFMERIFRQDLGKVRVHEGGEAESLNRELKSEAFTVGEHVFLGRKKEDESKRIETIGHELTHVVARRGGVVDPVVTQSSIRSEVEQAERRARAVERQIAGLARVEPRDRRAPRMPMEMAAVGTQESTTSSSRSDALPIQKKGTKFSDTPMQFREAAGAALAKPWAALFPRPPKRDLTPLVYQIWNKIKRQLAVDRERYAGGF